MRVMEKREKEEIIKPFGKTDVKKKDLLRHPP